MSDSLALFSPAVRGWFTDTFDEATPPQAEGWPAIQRGEHTLLLAPTGSGKTLAAFLWAIDRLYGDLAGNGDGAGDGDRAGRGDDAGHRDDMDSGANAGDAGGIHILYVSPLKALNNDVERNLRAPLEGIRRAGRQLGTPLPQLRVAVRTGDTPAHARQQMLKAPPHILITTPESLFLMLTSPRARGMFRDVRTIIVDEIHTLCGNKRGVHLSLTLERLSRLAGDVQRIGLSATQKPLEEVARFLGGQEWAEAAGGAELRPRPVTIIDTGYRKSLDLQIVTPVEDFRDLPANSVWPSLIPGVLDQIRRHRSTLVFTNSRRLAERTADRLNAQLAAEETEEIEPGSTEALAPGGLMRDRGIFAIGAEGPIRAHHGSMAKEARREMEEDLKAGRLPALVGTSSLELGIDIGHVDLVVQLQAPRSVAQGLQRVGRSGHLVGQTSKGRIYTVHSEDLLEAAAVARGMLEGDVEPTYTPANPLDVLAQQVVAMTAVDEWSVPDLYSLVRQAYAYRELPVAAFRQVLGMLAGEYYATGGGPLLHALRPRISWDRINDRLAPLPGTRLLALSNAGTIPDTGAFGVYLPDGKTRVGELDEEFVYETRTGDVFLLGSQTWRVLEVTENRVVVGDAAGQTPRMPFWNGELPWRPYELGLRIARFRGEVAARLAAGEDRDSLLAWLQADYALDRRSAANLLAYVERMVGALGALSSDRTILVEHFDDVVGELRMVIHSPFGGRVNAAWALALRDALRERLGTPPEVQISDDGILFRLPGMEGELPLDLIHMTAQEARERVLRELPNSPMFGAQFRMAASRALLLPRAHGTRRTPLWLQRLKAKELLAQVSRFPDFPLIIEAYRDCMRDVLDVPRLEEVLAGIGDGTIEVHTVRTRAPSPVAARLLFFMIDQYMYEWDAPKGEQGLALLAAGREWLDQLLGTGRLAELLDPDVVAAIEGELQHTAPGYRARSDEELAVILQALGDLTEAEAQERSADPLQARPWLQGLAVERRIVPLWGRWVAAELAGIYRDALGDGDRETGGQGDKVRGAARVALVRRYLATHGPVVASRIAERYGLPREWLEGALSGLVERGEALRGRFLRGVEEEQFCHPAIFDRIHRTTLAALRRAVQPVAPAQHAAFLIRWQHVHPQERLAGKDGLEQALAQLQGLAAPLATWERDLLPGRVTGFSPGWLDELVRRGEVVWQGAGGDLRRARLRFSSRGQGNAVLAPASPEELGADALQAHSFLKEEGASFLRDLQAGLRWSEERAAAALGELAVAGLATCDELQALRRLAGETAGAGSGPIESSLSADLAERRAAKPAGGPARVGSAEARRRYYQLRKAGKIHKLSPDRVAEWPGRWSPVHRTAVLGPELSAAERAERQAELLLGRYGILARELVEREEGPWAWAELYQQLVLMEMRGEVRRGYFVAGLSGGQFALPDAVEQLRSADTADRTTVVVSALDPAAPWLEPDVALGATPEILRGARIASTTYVVAAGRPVLLAEDNGQRLATAGDEEQVAAALEAYFSRPGAPRHVTVTTWNGGPVWGSPGEELLKTLGFYKSPAGMER